MVKCDCAIRTERLQEPPCEAMLHALKVMALDPTIRTWLQENDPNALRQAEFAIEMAEGGNSA